MKTRLFVLVTLVIGMLVLFPTPARADGIIIPQPPICGPRPCPPPPCPGPGPCPPMPPVAQLVIRYHHVTVNINDQIATTRVDQVFYNPNDWPVEGIYMFPIPLEAAVSSFTLWVDGAPIEGQVLDAKEARAIYEDIVRNMQDPALLEYADRGALQASIFPIPPGGERRIELEYTQVLTYENGLVRYTYPLNTEKFSVWPLESVAINVNIRSSSVPIRAVYSPSHEIAVSRESDYQVAAGYEASQVRPDKDFHLVYSLGEEQAFHLISYREPESDDPDGFFLAMIAPQPDIDTRSIPKDLILVLDKSGSMEGEKFQQAKQALQYILEHLNPGDRFNVLAFSTGLNTYADRLRPASQVNQAIDWVQGLSAQGSTDINRALLEAAYLVDHERPAYLIFLTDGLPTEGVVDSQMILDNLGAAAPENLRLFAFGVGYDVDTYLLDSLAQAHHGASTYVPSGSRLDEMLSSFYAKISTPVLTDLALDFEDIGAYDLYPDPLPDLFAGSQIVVVGRYRRPGGVTVTLTGEVAGLMQKFRFEGQVFVQGSSSIGFESAVPRLWATRKIGHLLNQIRLHGPDQETIDQIVRLSIRYGIVTPYTSYLVTEDMPLGAREQDRIAEEQFRQLESAPSAPAYGQDAVEKAAEQGALAGADSAAAPQQEAADVVRIVGARTFVLADDIWIDTAFDPERMQTVKVAFLSPEYFSLIEAYPELGAGFALGGRVIAFTAGVAYEVVEAGSVTPPIQLPMISPPEATQPAVQETKPVPLATGSAPLVQPGGTSVPQSDSEPEPVGSSNCLGGLIPLAVMIVFPLALRRRSSS